MQTHYTLVSLTYHELREFAFKCVLIENQSLKAHVDAYSGLCVFTVSVWEFSPCRSCLYPTLCGTQTVQRRGVWKGFGVGRWQVWECDHPTACHTECYLLTYTENNKTTCKHIISSVRII